MLETVSSRRPLCIDFEIESWPLKKPFSITGYTLKQIDVIVVTLERDGCSGRGEAAGVYYLKDNIATMAAAIGRHKAAIEAGIDREALLQLLPPCGARNAIDCALWDLEAKTAGLRAWQLAGLDMPRPLLTTFTCGAGPPEVMAADAIAYVGARAIKLKLTGEPADAERVRAVRIARPDVLLTVDANQGYSVRGLQTLMPVLEQSGVCLIEQPFPVGQEVVLKKLRSPIPIAADESVQSVADLDALVGLFDFINIKLDKCGGFTAGLAMAKAARLRGFKTMVGNMSGTSLAMAPACLLGQVCDVVDLDGPMFLSSDRAISADYLDGHVLIPRGLWG